MPSPLLPGRVWKNRVGSGRVYVAGNLQNHQGYFFFPSITSQAVLCSSPPLPPVLRRRRFSRVLLLEYLRGVPWGVLANPFIPPQHLPQV